MTIDRDTVYSTADLATMLSVPVPKIQEWARKRKLLPMAGTGNLFMGENVAEFVKENRQIITTYQRRTR